MKTIHFCPKCREYTMKETCPVCGGSSIDPKPPKFSPEDKWGKYRREMKESSANIK